MARGRAADYTPEEVIHFLNIAVSIKPVDLTGWQRVLQEHNLVYAHMNRTAESLRRKYNQLQRKKIPTGDPNCPEDVRLAKRVKYSINDHHDFDGHDDPNEARADRHVGETINMSDGVAASTFEGETEDERETDEDPNGSVGSVDEANGSGHDSNGNNGSPATNSNNGNRATNTVQIAAATNNSTTSTSNTNGNTGSNTAPAAITDALNKPTGKTRLLVTPRSKKDDETAKDMIQVQLLQMQQDRELMMLKMEDDRAKREHKEKLEEARREDDRAKREHEERLEKARMEHQERMERLERQQWRDMAMGAFGLYARANGITNGDGGNVSNNTGNSNTGNSDTGTNTTTANTESP
jgi:hypothetical protein